MIIVIHPIHADNDIGNMITTTEKTTLRQKMLEACIAKQQSLVDDFNTRISALMEKPGLGNEEEYDNDILSHQSQHAEEIDSLRAALKLAADEMNTLLYLKSNAGTNHNIAEAGAIVVTDKNTFLVSVSTEQFEVDGEPYIGVSTHSPIFKAMKGLNKGKTFRCKGINYKIQDIL